MSRTLKDLVVACVLTLVGLAVGMLLAGADVRAAPVDQHTEGFQAIGIADASNAAQLDASRASFHAAETKLLRSAGPHRERSVWRIGTPAAE